MRAQVLFHSALADETRLRLLCLMRDGEVCVCQLQSVLQTNQPKISRHLAYLRKARLVEARRDGKWTHYRLRGSSATRKSLLLALSALSGEPQIRKDAQRLRQVSGCPERYGVSLPPI